MQLAFLSLFLGLISGVQTVTVAAGDEVAAVEFRLDDRPLGKLSGPPWTTKLDLGADLLPHRLTARALDARGAELALAEQWINLPRPAAEVELVVERRDARTLTARLSWQSVKAERPERIELTLDGKTLALTAGRSATLAIAAEDQHAHLLAARVGFPGGGVASRQLAVSGSGATAAATELTAVTLRLRVGELPPMPELSGWLTDKGKPLQPVAVEQSAPKLLVVRDPAVPDALGHLLWFNRGAAERRGGVTASTRIRFIWPSARTAAGGGGIPAELFATSQDFGAVDTGLPALLARLMHGGESGTSRLADAVAVAGLAAYAGQNPRAVLLVLGPGAPHDASRYRPATSRAYLEALDVPLFVWSVGPVDPARRAAWGSVEDISEPAGLQRALQRLEQTLAAERVVWVEGRHLPQAITVAAPAAGRAELAIGPR